MGAEPADAARAWPLLDQLCRKVEHCGPVGAGAPMKLAINLPLMIGWQAYGEAFALVRDLGWEPKRLHRSVHRKQRRQQRASRCAPT